MIYRSLLLFFILLASQLQAQLQDVFVFRDFDKSVINIWLSGDDASSIRDDNEVLQVKWQSMRSFIEVMEIEHLDLQRFIADQDVRINQIYRYIAENNQKDARKESYILLNEFRNIRLCFTGDDYNLDHMLESYDAYLSVHEIIHDQMMGLYEWTEFIWYVDQLKCKVENLENKLFAVDAPVKSMAMREALNRVITCLETLDNSLGDAYRPDFEIPCNDLKLAFTDLFLTFSENADL